MSLLVKPTPARKEKKTKSRNGCGRCKLKRLKCDETTPSCLQCKKRDVACPGYEKTLRWSTKYEVLQPVHFASSPLEVGYGISSNTTLASSEIDLPPDVVSGFEAMAAFFPAKTKEVVAEEQEPRREPSPPDAAAVDQSETFSFDIPSIESEPISDHDPFFGEFSDIIDPISDNIDPTSDIINPISDVIDPISDNIDPILLEGSVGSIQDPEQLAFASQHDLHYPEPKVQEDLDLNIADELQLVPNSPSSRSLLLNYYRRSRPTLNTPCDIESRLVQHYFKDVCVLFSSFDSPLNPFRTTIGRVFRESPSMYYAIQSMAAAHLANTCPDMAGIGIVMQQKAIDCLDTELPLAQNGHINSTTTFLSIILLGLSTCWHESSALGENFLTTARNLILPKLLANSDNEEIQRETQFFEESLIYWEMLIGFVTQDDTLGSSSGLGMRDRVAQTHPTFTARNRLGKIVPHPWTGIAPTIQLLFAEVGRLVRSERRLFMDGVVNNRERRNNIQRRINLLNAIALEEDLLASEYPVAEELADVGDERTGNQDFTVIAEAYRCTGLLLIYRVFPSILRNRLGVGSFTWIDVEFQFPTPRFETVYENTDTRLWINSLALHILKTLEGLPSSSGTCCLQPILLLAAGSELKYVSSVDYFDVYANDAKILQAREFALRRLQEYSCRLPAKPVIKIIDLVKEVWSRLDGGVNSFWMDVMVEKGWQTVMG